MGHGAPDGQTPAADAWPGGQGLGSTPAATVTRSPRGGHQSPMPRIRQDNVTAAQWSTNGGALGSPDLTEAGNQVFGANVFSTAVQRQRLPKHVFKALNSALAKGEALDTSLADAVAQA